MRVGVLIGGENAVRAAHSLSADPLVGELVVLGPAKSRNFKVVEDPGGLDVLVGSGPAAPRQATEFGLPLIWDGNVADGGVAVWGASVAGIAAAIAARQKRPSLVAAAHPDFEQGKGRSVRFARPVGATQVNSVAMAGVAMALGRSYNEYAACLVQTKKRSVTVVDRAAFISGIALAAGVAVFGSETAPVWSSALKYLETASGMGLVMAEAS